MKYFLFLLLALIASVCSYTKLESLSSDDAINALKIIDLIENVNSTNEIVRLNKLLNEITGETYNISHRKQLYDIISDNTANIGIYSKISGLLSFKNFLLVCMVAVGVAFVISFMFNIVCLLGAYVGMLFYKIFLTKYSLYVQGLLLSFATLGYKVDQITNPYIQYLFIFDCMTPLFGCIIFYIVVLFVVADYFPAPKTKISIGYELAVDTFVGVIWTVAAIYHNNKIIGIVVIIMIFKSCGFLFGSSYFGYYTGFNKNDHSLLRCLLISIFLNAVMIFAKAEFITGDITAYLNIFDTGIYFWATLVGTIAMLIMSDEYYIKYKYETADDRALIFIMMQFIMVIYCLILIYLGNIFYITSYQGIGGTFLVLWALDIERTFLQKFKQGSTTIFLFIILVNLYLVKQYITFYPEYFII